MALFYCSHLKRRGIPAYDDINELIAKSYYSKCKNAPSLQAATVNQRMTTLISLKYEDIGIDQLATAAFIYIVTPELREYIADNIFKKIIDEYYDKSQVDNILGSVATSGD